MPTQADIQKLTKKLLPTGRAFKAPTNGVFDKLIRGLSVTETQAVNDANSIRDTLLPDNANFTAEDATLWEQRLGLITNPTVPLADRMLAIKRKMNHPSNIPARQHYLYIEKTLQDAGLNVWVHENIPETLPENYIVSGGTIAQLGDFTLGEIELGDVSTDIFGFPIQLGNPNALGMSQLGNNYENQIANHINPLLDGFFSHGQNFRSSFFIGGQVFGTFATVPANRQDEFRQLVLKVKPVNTIAYIYINYI